MDEVRGEQHSFDEPAAMPDSVSDVDARLSETARTFVRLLPAARVEEVDLGGYAEIVIVNKD